MCELIGLSASKPTDLCFSLTGFFPRGGITGSHVDGFGIGFFEPGGYRDFHDILPAARSPVARLLCEYPIESTIALGQVRQGNVGETCIENTYPFKREIGGVCWSYVMHGQIERPETLTLSGRFQPLGSTDGERAFCWLLDRLYEFSLSAPFTFTSPQLSAALHIWCLQLHEMGVYNMLLSEGSRLYAFCSKRLTYITRRAPFGQAALKDNACELDLDAQLDPDMVATVVATNPLTDEDGWVCMTPGELAVFHNGEQVELLKDKRRAS
ncbi:class II glutamine amidotransferase [Phytohalomonas tamaricis]|uniref:class II glutamine amidotransferase n=1 Tax=Phytohalomonas tamaricis TaxID=2081032 RepID=UPI000D0B7613|nr:class II glutamine amidotransferase [Phytohalomonas tamaricis]